MVNKTNDKENKMKTKKIKISAIKFENGDIILDRNLASTFPIVSYDYFVKTSNGVFIYNSAEMVELYNYVNNNNKELV